MPQRIGFHIWVVHAVIPACVESIQTSPGWISVADVLVLVQSEWRTASRSCFEEQNQTAWDRFYQYFKEYAPHIYEMTGLTSRQCCLTIGAYAGFRTHAKHAFLVHAFATSMA
ncbi:hypothetical protein FVE85_0981 [Porphyridium purpureum]|uniref:Uncharacterized protein n=1 Tax=Porphyridium purpureum TaxID=35688 RepID=A0A5J4Z280_PORPP|nr:hypothetical protein FVE85_0981 [Porphyridium purpureum]|eukprot:POR3035..scf208_2